MTNEDARPADAEGPGAGGALTKGFLFADLRGYTRYVETAGASAASDLLNRFRSVVRAAIAESQGAEIRTEGDSFYVVLPSASMAVRCALSIAASAERANAEQPGAPISVGVGIHAGEAIETGEGLIGSAVNIAARLCALAGPGEVLATDTVRALTRSTTDAVFVPRGRQRLKGLDDPVDVFAVRPRDAAGAVRPPGPGGARRDRRPLLAAVALALVAVPVAIVAASQLFGGNGAGSGSDPSDGLSSAAPSGALASTPIGSLSPTTDPWAEPSAGTPTMIVMPSLPPEGPPPVVPLSSGTYAFSEFDPSVAFTTSGDSWRAWRDYVDAAALQLVSGDPADPDARVLADVTLGRIQVVFEGRCLDSPTKLLESTPAAFIGWLSAQEDLETGDPVPVNLGGYSGLSVRSTEIDQEDHCELDGPAPRQFLFPVGQDFYSLMPGEAMDVTTLDVAGRPVSVLVAPATDLTAEERAIADGQVRALLESLDFSP